MRIFFLVECLLYRFSLFGNFKNICKVLRFLIAVKIVIINFLGLIFLKSCCISFYIFDWFFLVFWFILYIGNVLG